MNKTKIIFIIFLSLFFNGISAQTTDPFGNDVKRFQFIVKGGLTLSNTSKITAGQSGKESVIFGYNGGLMADIYLDGGIYLQTGANVTTKGSKIKKFTTEDKNKTSLRMDMLYLQVPLMFAFKIPVGNTDEDSFNIALGPYYAYGLDGKVKGRKKNSDFEKIKTFGKDGIYKDTDWGIVVQVQYEKNKFFLSYGAEIGLTNIVKKETLPAGFNNKIKNYSFGASVGYKF